MTISTHIYANLSPIERIRAAVSATARDDRAELQVLKDTCPKTTYLMTDPAYSEGMVNLMNTALAVEYDLQALALDFNNAVEKKDSEAVDRTMASAASLEKAWWVLLAKMGIPLREMSRAGPRRHHSVETLLFISDGEENDEEVQACLKSLREGLAT